MANSFRQTLENPLYAGMKTMHDDLLDGTGELVVNAFKELNESINKVKKPSLASNHETFVNEINKLKELQQVFGFAKNNDYEEETLNYKIYDKIQKDLVTLEKNIEDGDAETGPLFSDILELLQTYSDTKKRLKEKGIEKFASLKETKIKMGDMDVYQIE